MEPWVAAWRDLEPPWREAYELAWESWRAGSLGIGAVVVDPDGEFVARGRNRILEDRAPDGQIAGTRIAHAELNAVAQLRGEDGFREHALYTTLEPCLGCIGAIRMTMIGTVRFAADDPLWSGVNQLLANNLDVVRHWPRVLGPRDDPLATFARLLPLVRTIEHRPESRFLETYRRELPADLRLAETLAASRVLHGTPDLLDALASVWDALDQTRTR